MRWYVVEQAESHIVGEGHQEFTTDKHYAEYLLKKLTKQRDLGMIDYVPIMREATEEETALLEFDFNLLENAEAEVVEIEDGVFVDIDTIEEDFPF